MTLSVKDAFSKPIGTKTPHFKISLYLKEEAEAVSMNKDVWFWKNLFPLLRRFCKEHKVAFNRVVNLAVEQFLGCCHVEELRLKARLAGLMREEAGLRQSMRVMLRSGSFLPQYADKLLRERYEQNVPEFLRKGQVPLKALNAKEEDVARRVLAERERIAQEIADILAQLLPEKRFRLKPSRSRARDKKTVWEVN